MKKMTLDLHDVAVNDLLNEVTATIEPLAAKKNNKLIIKTSEAPLKLYSDSVKIRQCLLNLLSNACKFTENGTVTLNIDSIIPTNGEQQKIAFSVTDTGIGMSKDQLNTLFEAFVQADASTTRKYGGTGLGLVITRKLAQLLGGDVSVNSEEGKGSIFRIEIPVDASNLEMLDVEPTTQQATIIQEIENSKQLSRPQDGSKPLVLIIDDDPSAVDLMKRMLTGAGFNVASANDGVDGLKLAENSNPHAIILDINMPEMDGWQVLDALTSNTNTSQIPVFIVTIDDERKRGIELGASEYLLKPIKRERLIELLSVYLNSDDAEVLLVEDDQDSAEIVVRAATQAGHGVRHVVNGVEAIQALDEKRPDIIILDLMMPEMDGFEFLRKIRSSKDYRDIPVIVVSAKTLSEEDRGFLSEMAQQYHQKTALPPGELVQAIDKLTGVATVH